MLLIATGVIIVTTKFLSMKVRSSFVILVVSNAVKITYQSQ